MFGERYMCSSVNGCEKTVCTIEKSCPHSVVSDFRPWLQSVAQIEECPALLWSPYLANHS